MTDLLDRMALAMVYRTAEYYQDPKPKNPNLTMTRELAHAALGAMWLPIAELEEKDRYATNLLLCAPELVDADCNTAGVAPGYWADDRDGAGQHGWVAAGYDMNSDKWTTISVNPTHFTFIRGPND